MPIINLKVSGQEDPTLAEELANEISRITKEILKKKPEVTVVTVSFVPDYLWFINSASLAELKTKSFHLHINITDSTNLKIEKADYIKAVHKSLTILLGSIHPVSYTAIQEMKADAYGYEGSTIEYKYINNQKKNDSIPAHIVCNQLVNIDMENSKSLPITVDPNGGEILSIVGDNYRVLVSGKQTNGAFATIDMLIPPQSGPGPHSHTNFYESFYIVDGEVEVHSEAGFYKATKGSFVVIPKGGVVHYFKNVSDQLAHLLCTVVPAGLEAFFEEIGEPVAAGEFMPPPPMDEEAVKKLQAIAQKHGQVVYPPDFLDKK